MSTTSAAPRAGGDIATTLRRIEQRLARLEATLAPAAELVSNGEATIATVGDILDEKVNEIGDLDHRLRSLTEIVERLTRPRTLKTLSGLVDIAEEAPNIVATTGDIIDEAIANGVKEGLEPTRVVDQLRSLSFGALKFISSNELDTLLNSGMLDPRALQQLGLLATALADASEKEAPQVGLFGAVGRLGDADVKRAVGFLLEVAGNLGRSLKNRKQLKG